MASGSTRLSVISMPLDTPARPLPLVRLRDPEIEIVDRLVFNDFLALLDPQEREVVVLLRSGTTKLTQIADIMGYRNHSPISKRLNRIRDTASRFFDDE